MEILNKINEDGRYVLEMTFGHAKETVHFDGKNGPVIGISGFAGGFLSDSVKKYMKDNSVRGILSRYDAFDKGLVNYFDKIENDVRSYPKATILAFSAAGISALLWASIYNKWSSFQKIITIASPFAGLQVPSFMKIFGQTIADLQLNSPFIKEVSNIKPPQGKVLSLFAQYDEHIKNPQDLNLNWPSAILASKSHGGLQNHGVLLENILNAELGITPR